MSVERRGLLHAEYRSSGGARTADNQRERNHSNSREIFAPAD